MKKAKNEKNEKLFEGKEIGKIACKTAASAVYYYSQMPAGQYTRACTGFDGGLAAGEAIRRRCVKSQT